MQKRPNYPYRVEYAPYTFSADFPIEAPGQEKHIPSEEAASQLHFHNCLEIGYCYEGAGIFFVDDRIFPFSQGDVSILFKNQIHIAQSERGRPSQWEFIFLDPYQLLADINIRDFTHVIDAVQGTPEFPSILSPELYREITSLVSILLSELKRMPKQSLSVIKGLVWALIAMLERLTKTANRQHEEMRHTDLLRIAPALEYVSHNYMEDIRIGDLARMCNASVTNFRRIFKQAMHMSPLEYITNVRIRMASILLDSMEYSVLDISLKVGYTTLSSFNRHFQKVMGQSPKQWRTSCRAGRRSFV